MPKTKQTGKAERIASKSRLTRKDVEELALAADRGIIARWKRAARE